MTVGQAGRLALGSLALWGLSACEGTKITPSREWISPDELDFGARAIGQRHTKLVTLTNLSGDGTVVGAVNFDPDVAAFNARTPTNETLTGQTLAAGRSLDFVVNFDPTAVRAYDTTMLITLGETEVPLPITAAGIQPPLEVELRPSSIDFGPVPVSNSEFQRITVRNEGDGAFRLREVLLDGLAQPETLSGATFYVTRANGPDAVRDLDFAPRQSHELFVYYQPTVAKQDRVELQLRIGEAEPITVPVTGTGFLPGELVCAPDFHDFGVVGRGRTERVQVTCSASGGDVGVAAIAFEGGSSPPFMTEDAPRPGQLIREGEPVSFNLGFRSVGLPAQHQARFELVHVGGAAPTPVSLLGEVVPPQPQDTAVTVQLTWDTVGTDLDLHFVRGGRAPFSMTDDCYFRARNPNWGVIGESLDDPYLDQDDTNGEGPETMNLLVAGEPSYDIYVHFYKAPPGGLLTQVRVLVYAGGVLVGDRSRPLSVCGELWKVGQVSAASGTFSPMNVVTNSSGDNACP